MGEADNNANQSQQQWNDDLDFDIGDSDDSEVIENDPVDDLKIDADSTTTTFVTTLSEDNEKNNEIKTTTFSPELNEI